MVIACEAARASVHCLDDLYGAVMPTVTLRMYSAVLDQCPRGHCSADTAADLAEEKCKLL